MLFIRHVFHDIDEQVTHSELVALFVHYQILHLGLRWIEVKQRIIKSIPLFLKVWTQNGDDVYLVINFL